jgi:hypothetical protein
MRRAFCEFRTAVDEALDPPIAEIKIGVIRIPADCVRLADEWDRYRPIRGVSRNNPR